MGDYKAEVAAVALAAIAVAALTTNHDGAIVLAIVTFIAGLGGLEVAAPAISKWAAARQGP